MNKPKAAGRMIQRAIELRQFDIEYHPRTTIKVHALANFIAEFTIPGEEGAPDKAERWMIQTDDSSARKGGGVGVIIITPERETIKYGIQLTFPTTNNEAEYKGVLTGLKVGKALGVKNLLVQSDLKLVVEQIKGKYKAKEERMQNYLRLMKLLTQEFDRVEFTQVLRSQNMGADKLAKQASSETGPTNTDLKMEV
ncbi:uncharacterized protein LOC142608906 [Castanea sativa]|uniref:uncharacterized protein LOC142608906 n=1 Tax=Castanea sativa TaxID=21020 RepID=UPI003F64B832